MLAEERRALILEELRENGIVKVSGLSKKFNITVETARHDIAVLQEKGLAKKIYGGAVPADGDGAVTVTDTLYESRESVYIKEKMAIGRTAAEMVHDGDTIFLGSGTTVLEFAKCIKDKRKLTVITNSLTVVMELLPTDAHMIIIGGEVRSLDMNTLGTLALNDLKNFYVDCAFISTVGVSATVGTTNYNSEEALFNKQIQKQAARTILLADSSKMGRCSTIVQADVAEYAAIITDSNISNEQKELFKNRGIQLTIAEV